MKKMNAVYKKNIELAEKYGFNSLSKKLKTKITKRDSIMDAVEKERENLKEKINKLSCFLSELQGKDPVGIMFDGQINSRKLNDIAEAMFKEIKQEMFQKIDQSIDFWEDEASFNETIFFEWKDELREN